MEANPYSLDKSMNQRQEEWLNLKHEDYHSGQFGEPYRSTIKFCDWIDEQHLIDNEAGAKPILDVGAGQGANLSYFADRYPDRSFQGLELNQELVTKGNLIFQDMKKPCRLDQGDLYDFPGHYNQQFDGLVCLQTLSWLPSFESAMNSLFSLEPNWIGISSLFFDGELNCTIRVDDLQNSRECYYNVYSLSLFESYCKQQGYEFVKWKRFIIDKDLPSANPRGLGTYTKKLESGERMQFSGPLNMPWYFVSVQRAV